MHLICPSNINKEKRGKICVYRLKIHGDFKCSQDHLLQIHATSSHDFGPNWLFISLHHCRSCLQSWDEPSGLRYIPINRRQLSDVSCCIFSWKVHYTHAYTHQINCKGISYTVDTSWFIVWNYATERILLNMIFVFLQKSEAKANNCVVSGDICAFSSRVWRAIHMLQHKAKRNKIFCLCEKRKRTYSFLFWRKPGPA
jgi:hypothetical protein